LSEIGREMSSGISIGFELSPGSDGRNSPFYPVKNGSKSLQVVSNKIRLLEAGLQQFFRVEKILE